MEFLPLTVIDAEMIRRGLMEPPPLFTWTTEPHPDKQFISIPDSGIPRLHFHARQDQVWNSQARFVAAIAGSQSGKTALGPWWLLREMQRRGPGNYMLVAGTYTLLGLQAVPSLQNALETILQLGKVQGGSQGRFIVSEEGHQKIWPTLPYEPTKIVFGYAANPNSLESLTAKAAWVDECGATEFKQASHEAILARLSINEGRILYTSTPYTHNWFKTEVHDRAERNRKSTQNSLPPNPADAGYEAFNYESRMNPVFPQSEWDRQKLILPAWRFDMRYRGLFTRPAGAIYDCFEPDFHKLKAGYVPDPKWRIYAGIDFGAPNYAAVFIAEEPGTKKVVAFAEYRPAESKKLADHVAGMHAVLRKVFDATASEWAKTTGKPKSEWTNLPAITVAGAKAEGQWRQELAAAGWPSHPPDQPEVEVQISRVYAAFREDRFFISEDCPHLLSDMQTISRPVDDDGNPLEGIEDEDIYHSHAACRYIISRLNAVNTGTLLLVF